MLNARTSFLIGPYQKGFMFMPLQAITEVQVGRYNYVFRITERGHLWRIYILTRPKNSIYSISGVTAHMNEDQFGRKYICWDRNISTYQDAVNVAVAWARNYHNFVYTGQRF